MTPGAPELQGWRAHKSTTMKAIDILDAVLKYDIRNDVAGIVKINDTPITNCFDLFGDCSMIIPPKPNTVYVYEWLHHENLPEIGTPNAILIQPREDETMLIYLYEVEE